MEYLQKSDEHIIALGKIFELVDPLEYAQLLNSTADELTVDEARSPAIRAVIEAMLQIAAGKHEEGGAQMVGLAAPQIGVSKRIAIVDINATGMRKEQNMLVMINPRIIEQSDDAIDGREGCWSCGDFCANVPRASSATISALDRDGNPMTHTLDGFTARIVQHEVDHLDGVRCIDRVPVEEPWRLHLVNKADKDEFDSYRVNWQHWTKTFPRSEWEHFREGDVRA